MKRLFRLTVIILVLSLFAGCRRFSNPVDPEAEDYIGTSSEDDYGDGIAQYEDVDEIVLISPVLSFFIPYSLINSYRVKIDFLNFSMVAYSLQLQYSFHYI